MVSCHLIDLSIFPLEVSIASLDFDYMTALLDYDHINVPSLNNPEVSKAILLPFGHRLPCGHSPF